MTLAHDKHVAHDSHTAAPGPLERTCWRRFAVLWGDCKKSRRAPLNAIIIIILLLWSGVWLGNTNIVKVGTCGTCTYTVCIPRPMERGKPAHSSLRRELTGIASILAKCKKVKHLTQLTTTHDRQVRHTNTTELTGLPCDVLIYKSECIFVQNLNALPCT